MDKRAMVTRRGFGLRVAAAGAGAGAAGAGLTLGRAQRGEYPNFFPTKEVTELTVSDPEHPKAASLSVSIKKLGEADLKIIPSKKEDEPDEYYWKGQKLPPYDFYGPGCTMITGFQLKWGGKEIPVAERFWNDLPRLRLEKIILPKRQLNDEEEIQYMMQQRANVLSLKISEHGGTVMISWQRPEE